MCASSRAVFLDLVPDPSCAAFVRSAKRFFSKFDVPRMFISDNATCFTGPELTKYLQLEGSTWQFILQASPWWGGFWERLVQSTKRCLRKCLGKAKLTYEELLTLLSEIERVLNNRPLCRIPDDSVDEVLTPSHLLRGKRLCGPRVDEDPPKLDASAAELGERLAYLNRLLEHFWSRWKHEYLTQLREHQNCRNRIPVRRVQSGDVVLIEDNLPRNRWKMGVVTELFTGRDGFVRGCKVRTLTSKTKRVTHLNRPVNKLYPLEIESVGDSQSSNAPIVDTDVSSCDTAFNENADIPTIVDANEEDAISVPISDRRSRVLRKAAESGILKRMLAKQT